MLYENDFNKNKNLKATVCKKFTNNKIRKDCNLKHWNIFPSPIANMKTREKCMTDLGEKITVTSVTLNSTCMNGPLRCTASQLTFHLPWDDEHSENRIASNIKEKHYINSSSDMASPET